MQAGEKEREGGRDRGEGRIEGQAATMWSRANSRGEFGPLTQSMSNPGLCHMYQELHSVHADRVPDNLKAIGRYESRGIRPSLRATVAYHTSITMQCTSIKLKETRTHSFTEDMHDYVVALQCCMSIADSIF